MIFLRTKLQTPVSSSVLVITTKLKIIAHFRTAVKLLISFCHKTSPCHKLYILQIRRLGKYELKFVNRTKTLIYSPKLKLLLFNIISLVCDTLAPAVRKLAVAAQEEVLDASVATPVHLVSFPHYCETFFRADAPLGGRRGDSLREQGPDYMEDVIELSILVYGWCPWCEQPRVDGRYPGEMTLMFVPFFSCS